MKVRFLLLAQQELDDACTRYNEKAGGLGKEYLDESDRAVRRTHGSLKLINLREVVIQDLISVNHYVPRCDCFGKDVCSSGRTSRLAYHYLDCLQ
jgi:hypothetical protein